MEAGLTQGPSLFAFSCCTSFVPGTEVDLNIEPHQPRLQYKQDRLGLESPLGYEFRGSEEQPPPHPEALAPLATS